MLMEEIWKDIKGYEGFYQVSNMGRVKSVDRVYTTNNRWGGISHKCQKGRVLKPFTINSGYLIIHLGRKKKCLIHRLVYEAFMGPIPEGMQVNHINEDKKDNRLENLNLMTPKENHNWGTGHIRAGKKQKKPIIQIKDQKEFICWFSQKDASQELHIDIICIWKALKGRYKTAGGFKWRYA